MSFNRAGGPECTGRNISKKYEEHSSKHRGHSDLGQRVNGLDIFDKRTKEAGRGQLSPSLPRALYSSVSQLLHRLVVFDAGLIINMTRLAESVLPI